MRFDFCKGGDYRAASPLASALALINWRSSPVEVQNGRTAYILLPTSGLSLYANLNTAAGTNLPSTRGSYTASGRTFFVAGTHLFEVQAGGNVVDYGAAGGNNNIVDDGLTVTMVAGGTVGGGYPSQLLICSGGTLSVFSLVSNTFQALTTPPTNNLMVDFLGGFFAALSQGNIWSVSAAEDATTWPGSSVAQVSVFSDQLLSLIECNELIWVMGAKHIAAYYLSGAPIFPFEVTSGGVISMGILAQYSAARIQTRRWGKALAWLGGDDQGAGVVYMMNGFIPQRISDSALEYWLSQQSTISDAVGIPIQEEGENFYELWFPSAKTTWRLHVDTGWWHRLSSVVGGRQADHLGRCHTYNFGLHLVGDRTTGKVYAMSSNYLVESTGPGVFSPIIRTRIGPTLELEGGQLTVPINEFQLDVETGMGPQPPLTDSFGLPRDPLAMFSYSEDYGKTWSAERMIPCGQAGQSKIVAIDRRLGSWRSWTPKVTVSDPIQWRVVDAYVNGTQDSQERYSKRMARVS